MLTNIEGVTGTKDKANEHNKRQQKKIRRLLILPAEMALDRARGRRNESWPTPKVSGKGFVVVDAAAEAHHSEHRSKVAYLQ